MTDVLHKRTTPCPRPGSARPPPIKCPPGTVQEILDTGDQDLIDQAFDQMGIEDLTAYLQALPSPSVPAGVRSQASRTPSIDGARTPHHGSPRLSSGARSPPSWGSARLLAAAGAGGGGGGGGSDGSGRSGGRRSTPRGRPGRRGLYAGCSSLFITGHNAIGHGDISNVTSLCQLFLIL